MSLWTPSGEHRVPRDRAGQSAGDAPPSGDEAYLDDEAALIADALAAVQEMPAEERHVLLETLASLGVTEPEAVSEEDLARHLLALNSLAATQQRLLEEPVASHVASHLVGLHQLAALHLAQPSPSLPEAQLAIDAMAAALDAVGDRLGEAEPHLRQGLVQLQQLFVQAAG
jgi:hypothetical protein